MNSSNRIRSAREVLGKTTVYIDKDGKKGLIRHTIYRKEKMTTYIVLKRAMIGQYGL